MIDARLIDRMAVSTRLYTSDVERVLGLCLKDAIAVMNELELLGLLNKGKGTQGRVINKEKLLEYLP